MAKLGQGRGIRLTARLQVPRGNLAVNNHKKSNWSAKGEMLRKRTHLKRHLEEQHCRFKERTRTQNSRWKPKGKILRNKEKIRICYHKEKRSKSR